jgi:TM2 domain-containing membrane protein YozV
LPPQQKNAQNSYFLLDLGLAPLNMNAVLPYPEVLADPAGESMSTPPSRSDASSKKIAAGICGILIGGLGIHKFILGNTTPALIMLLVTICTCGFGGIVMGIIGLIEGIIYLTKSDDEFYETYMVEKKPWF